MNQFEYKFQTSDKLEIFCREWKPDSEPAAVICLIHGKGEHSGRYANTAAAFTQAGYVLTAFDLRGHGKSDGKRGHIPSYEILMNDIAYFLDEAAKRYPGLPLFLYGHSMGGNLVLNYVIRRRPRIAGVIVTSPWLCLTSKSPSWKIAIARLLYKFFPSFTMNGGMDNKYLSRDSEVIHAYENDPIVHDRISVRLALDVIRNGKWALEHAGEFPLPLLLMHGTADRLTSPEASRRFIDNVSGECSYKFWENLFHEIHNEPEQKEVFEFTVNWLKNHH